MKDCPLFSIWAAGLQHVTRILNLLLHCIKQFEDVFAFCVFFS